MKPINNYGLSDSLIDTVRKAVKEAKLHSNQQKLDVHEPEKDELTSQDFKKLRAGKKVKDGIDTKPKLKEEEQIDEVKLADLPRRKVVGKSYGADYVDPEGADDADDMKKAEPKRKSGPQGTMKRRFIKDKSKLRMQYK